MDASILLGKAIQDYQTGNYTYDLFQETTISDKDVLPLPYLFRDFNKMPQLEQKALELAQGRVLDVGAGAGSHSLYLQNKGLQVTALDISPESIGVCKARRVEKTITANVLEYSGEQFNTILLLMNGTGIFGQLKNVPTYLSHLKSLLAPGGQILIDSSDLVYMYDRLENGAIMVPVELEYYGELECVLHYKSQSSDPYYWLYLDVHTFTEICKNSGFDFTVVAQGKNHDYLAKLSIAE